MIAFENKFSAIISQSQQPAVATSPLRSPLGFCRRSTLLVGVVFLLLVWSFSLLRLG